MQRFPLLRGCFTCMTIYLDPHKQSVIQRFPLLGNFVIRGPTVYYSTNTYYYTTGVPPYSIMYISIYVHTYVYTYICTYVRT